MTLVARGGNEILPRIAFVVRKDLKVLLRSHHGKILAREKSSAFSHKVFSTRNWCVNVILRKISSYLSLQRKVMHPRICRTNGLRSVIGPKSFRDTTPTRSMNFLYVQLLCHTTNCERTTYVQPFRASRCASWYQLSATANSIKFINRLLFVKKCTMRQCWWYPFKRDITHCP